jgi:hypothetical protein
MGRSVLASGELGKHNGLPATTVVVKMMHYSDDVGGWVMTRRAATCRRRSRRVAPQGSADHSDRLRAVCRNADPDQRVRLVDV